MKKNISVRRPDGSRSEVVIGEALPELESRIPAGKRAVIITDNNLYSLYGNVVGRYEHIVIGTGEKNKTLDTVSSIYARFLEMEVDRASCYIIGLGGGIVTDIAGFAASTYMRGIPFGFAATTLLAQVDASVGGKNGVNFQGYKNMVGTFNQPDFVLCDTGMLGTLPEREFRTGLAEIIKSGLIADKGLFELFLKHHFNEFRTDQELLLEAITRSVQVKAAIVEADEREHGDRKKLNLGHTLAHAIEKCSRDYTHGEAVAAGLCYCATVSEKLGTITAAEMKIVIGVIEKMGLPSSVPIARADLVSALRNDKKRESDSISYILMRGIGECEIRKMGFNELESLL